VHEQPRRIELRARSGETPLDHLELADRLAERLSLLRIGDRNVERRAAEPDRESADPDPPAVQHDLRVLEALAVTADAVGLIHTDVLEDQLRRVRRVEAHLLLALAGSEPFCSATDPERGEPAIPGACEHHRESRERSVGDELLGPAHDVLVTFESSPGLHADRVGTGRRLGQRPAAEVLAACERREPACLLLLAGSDQKVADAERVVRGDRQRDRPVSRPELFHDHRDREHLEPRAAVLDRNREAGEPERRELREELERKHLLLVPTVGVGRDPRADEVAHGVPNEKLFVAVREVQGVLSAPEWDRDTPSALRGSSGEARRPCAGPPRGPRDRRRMPPVASS